MLNIKTVNSLFYTVIADMLWLIKQLLVFRVIKADKKFRKLRLLEM